MRRLARWTLNALTALSLLLFFAVCVLWVRSYWASDTLTRGPGWAGREVQLESLRGAMYFIRSTGKELWGWHLSSLDAWPAWEGGWGVGTSRLIPIKWFHRSSKYEPIPATVIIVSDWVLLLIASALPTRFVTRYFNRRRAIQRADAGLCPGCGYDLRATPDKCPEYGRAAEGAAGVAAGG